LEVAIVYVQSQLPDVIYIYIAASSGAPAAVNLYKKIGFQQYGIEPCAVRVDDVFYDEHVMALQVAALDGTRLSLLSGWRTNVMPRIADIVFGATVASLVFIYMTRPNH
jgi:hypothetical protein